jgi:SlyX protein
MTDTDQRIDDLEIRIAHQDRAIAELNEVITQQWRRIDALERKLTRLIEEMEVAAPTRDGPEPPPPHY